jgi:hypothetical protein
MLSGLQLMQARKVQSEILRSTFDAAWQKFKVHFSISCCKHSSLGFEGYGFATNFNDPLADEKLLNQLPLLQYFAQNLRAKNREIFELLDDNRVDLLSLYGLGFMNPSVTVHPMVST